ncbi:MAG: HDOD domain-containing protein, partial [Planctomycetota bacterium]
MNDATTRAQARRVELILERVASLPTLSTVAQKLLTAGSHDEIDIQELARLIEADPSLTGKVLSMCRSADKGLGDKITSVQRAITLLGLDAVTSAVLSVEVFEILSKAQGASGRVEFDAVGHWRHAIAVAAGAELIMRSEVPRGTDKHAKPETAFVAGLLHSIGRIALEIVLPDAYSKVLRVAAQRGEDSAKLERDIIGIDHAAAGKKLAEHWGLPKMFRDCVWMHGQPIPSLPNVPHRELITVVGVARSLAKRLNLGWSGDFGPPPDVHELALAAGFDPDRIEQGAVALVGVIAERSTVLGLSETSGPELMIESVLRANARLAQLNQSFAGRSAHGEQQRKTLKALTAFHEACAGRGLTAVLSAAACSARSVVGGVFAGAVIQTGGNEPWQALRFDSHGGLLGSAVEPGPELAGGEIVRLVDVITDDRATADRRRAVLP